MNKSPYGALQDEGFRPETILKRRADVDAEPFKEPLTGARMERALADFTLDLCHALRFPRHLEFDGKTRIQRSLDRDETMWIEVSRKTWEPHAENDKEHVVYRAQFWRKPDADTRADR